MGHRRKDGLSFVILCLRKKMMVDGGGDSTVAAIPEGVLVLHAVLSALLVIIHRAVPSAVAPVTMPDANHESQSSQVTCPKSHS